MVAVGRHVRPASDARRDRPRPPGTFRIGRIAGSDVLVSLVVVPRRRADRRRGGAPRSSRSQPGLGAWKYVAGLAFAVVLYLSVLLHEASHALMARHYGFPVRSITLHFLGGMTAIEGEARTPRAGVLIAVVGPLTSLAVGAARSALWFVTPDGLLLMAVEGLAGANLLVGVLNLVPGLPLDGGRVLKAAVWGPPATCTAAPSSPPGAVGSPRSPCSPGRSSRSAVSADRRTSSTSCSRSSSRCSCGPAPPRR